MFDTLFSDKETIARHRDGPFALERECYLRYNAAVGASMLTQNVRARALLLVARTLTPSDVGGVGAERLRELIESIRPCLAPATATNLVNIARPWFKFLGWWHVPVQPTPFAAQRGGRACLPGTSRRCCGCSSATPHRRVPARPTWPTRS